MTQLKNLCKSSVVRQFFNGMLNSLRKDSTIFLEHSRCHVYEVINRMDATDDKKLLCKMAYDELWREHERNRRVDLEREIQIILELTLYSA